MNFMELTMGEVDILLKRKVLKFQYTNWKGDTAIRTVQPLRISYTTSLYHADHGVTLFLEAIDLEKNQHRDFLCKDIEIEFT